MSDDADNTARKQRAEVLEENAFKPGQSGNPAGRPKGARSKLGEAFLAAMLADWEEHGVSVIERVRLDKPDVYLKVAASLLPRELNVRSDELDDLTDEQLEQRIRALLSMLRAQGQSFLDETDATLQ